MNYGQMSQEEHQRELQEWDRERREAAEREAREHLAANERSQAQMIERGFMPDPNIPVGPPPGGISTRARPRALPSVHEVLRANDPKALTTNGC